jgi:hypothetical protein
MQGEAWSELTRRIELLERQARRSRWVAGAAIALGAAGVLAGQAPPVAEPAEQVVRADRVIARTFELRDAQDTLRAAWGMERVLLRTGETVERAARLHFTAGGSQVAFGQLSTGGMGMEVVAGDDALKVLRIGSAPDTGAWVELRERDRPRFALRLSGQGVVAQAAELSGRSGATLSLMPGGPKAELTHDGQLVWTVP